MYFFSPATISKVDDIKTKGKFVSFLFVFFSCFTTSRPGFRACSMLKLFFFNSGVNGKATFSIGTFLQILSEIGYI